MITEEPLGDHVVFAAVCNINQRLDQANVRAPHNASFEATLPADAPAVSDRIDPSALSTFEHLLKSSVVQEGSEPWTEFKGSPHGRSLYQRFRSFLGDFFDHDKELNAIVAQANRSDPRALVFLDDAKIKSELSDLGVEDGDDGSVASKMLSTRQVEEILTIFAGMGVGSSNARVRRHIFLTSTTPTATLNMYYEYKLHQGDSIIGTCIVSDADALAKSSQYVQVVKVQLIQSEAGAFDSSVDVDDAVHEL